MARLDRFDLIVPGDISDPRHDQAETSVSFEPIAERCLRKSIEIDRPIRFR
jgi:hypothetical protein